MYLPGINLTGNDLFDYKVQNYDYLKSMMSLNQMSRNTTTVYQNGSIAMLGPWKGPGVLSGGAMVCRHSLFLHDDGSWDLPRRSEWIDQEPRRTQPCPPEICTTPDNRTFWGFIATIFPLTYVTVPGLKDVREHNLRYALMNDAWDYGSRGYPKVLASSPTMPDAKIQVCQVLNVFDWMTWNLCVSPNSNGSTSSWTPVWAPALYVAATLIALFISCLIFLVLHSLGKQVEWNKEQKAQAKLLKKTLASLETERDSQLTLLREILPESVISVLLNHLHKSNAIDSMAAHSYTEDPSLQSSNSSSLSMEDVMNLATAHDEVTVIFADIKSFTSMSSLLHPSQVMLMLNDLL
jgi:hypothetical protein